jgi:hypothetical protein
MTKLAKLDRYDYRIVPDKIRIKLTRTNDPILVDILSEIHNSDGKIYVDGHFYSYLGTHQIVTRRNNVFLELHVSENRTV